MLLYCTYKAITSEKHLCELSHCKEFKAFGVYTQDLLGLIYIAIYDLHDLVVGRIVRMYLQLQDIRK